MDTEMNPKESFSLHRLLAWLDDDPLEAGGKYVQFQQQLIEYIRRHGGHTVAEDLADEAFNRVDKRLAISLLNEHFNSTEIGDVPNLCLILLDEGAKNSPSPSRRIWGLLSPADQSLVSTIAREGTFKRIERSRLSEALNEILSRRDFYRAEDFNLSAIRAEARKNSKIENIEAAYPQTIKTNLADTPDTEKLARCKHYAGIVLLEYQKEPHNFKTSIAESGESKPEDANRETTLIDALDNFIKLEDEEEKQRLRACLIECKRQKLSPRDSEIFDLYFTGIIIRSPDDEPLSDREIKEARKTLAEKYDVSPETIRTIVRRCILVLLPCINRCMKRQEKK